MLKTEGVYRTSYATKALACGGMIRHIGALQKSTLALSVRLPTPQRVHYRYQQPALAASMKPQIPLFEIPAAARLHLKNW